MSTEEEVVARVKAVALRARCRTCGTTVEDCNKMREGNSDPIGCCMPHDHSISPAELGRAAKEIATGEAPEPSALDCVVNQGTRVYHYLNQSAMWHPRPPAGPVAITAMDPRWRRNAAAMLLRNARVHATMYGWGELMSLVRAGMSADNEAAISDDMAHWDEERARDPEAWLQETDLYKALLAGLE